MRIARSPSPATFILDLALALRSIDGDDSIVAEQLLSDHSRFQGVISSVFSEATASQDIKYVLQGLEVSAAQSDKLKKLYESFDFEYTKLVLDGLAAFRSDEGLIEQNKAKIVASAQEAARSSNLTYHDQVVSLTAQLFAHWSLTNLNDLIKADDDSSARLSKYLMKPHAAQVIGCWILLNAHNAADFHDIQHHLAELKTGEGKSIVLGVVSTILALWGYTVDVVCYSSYLSQRDSNAFQRMFSEFEVDCWIWYGTLEDLAEKHLGLNYREMAENLIRGSSILPPGKSSWRPSVFQPRHWRHCLSPFGKKAQLAVREATSIFNSACQSFQLPYTLCFIADYL
jgi:hypothetical protein